jgi:hypothetical protein
MAISINLNHEFCDSARKVSGIDPEWMFATEVLFASLAIFLNSCHINRLNSSAI